MINLLKGEKNLLLIKVVQSSFVHLLLQGIIFQCEIHTWLIKCVEDKEEGGEDSIDEM